MKTFKLENFTRGWIVGDFEPSIIRTKDFEVAVMYFKKGDKGDKHFHKIAEEITVITSGVFKINNQIFKAGDVILLNQNEVYEEECLEDGSQTVIKTPSAKNDKFLVN